MKSTSFPGTFTDGHGTDEIVWRLEPYTGPSRTVPSFVVRTTIRGVECWGFDVDSIGPDPDDHPEEIEELETDQWGHLLGLSATGKVPCILDDGDETVASTLIFALGPPTADSSAVSISVTIGDQIVESHGHDFEDTLEELTAKLPPGLRLRCCYTCLFSDYSPWGTSGSEMFCHRNDRDQYLQVTTKADYIAVPITENVPAFYVCEEWTQRTPGTGYRG